MLLNIKVFSEGKVFYKKKQQTNNKRPTTNLSNFKAKIHAVQRESGDLFEVYTFPKIFESIDATR